MENKPRKKWYTDWKFGVMVLLIVLLLVWLLLPDAWLDAQSGINI